MSTLSCRILLFLAMVPSLVAAGRSIPGSPSTASSTTTPHVKLTWLSTSGEDYRNAELAWKYSSLHLLQDSSAPSPRVPSFRNSMKRDYVEGSIFGHRILLGSAPPSCQGKCGLCVPCNPIHFSLGGPHGSIAQQEYYPEVWRCKCGNKFFMP